MTLFQMLSACAKVKGKLVCTAVTVLLIIFALSSKITTDSYTSVLQSSSVPLWEQTLNFEKLNFNNYTGTHSGCYLVPNYIHYVSFGGKPINYIQLVCILAAFKNQKPEKMFFHYDDKQTFTGKYWEVLEKMPGFKDIIVYNRTELPREVFGQPLSDDWRKWHGSDVVRVQVLMKYGGVYLDADSYLVQSIDNYRRFEMVVNWDEEQFLGNQVLIAHKDARFLKKYLDCYKSYDKEKWYYNAGERPTVEVLYKEPELIHRVKVLFGADIKFAINLFQHRWSGWRDMYAIHLLSNHQYLFKNLSNRAKFPVEFDENNIAYYNVTFREMAYEVYDIANIKWPKRRLDGNLVMDSNHKRFIN